MIARRDGDVVTPTQAGQPFGGGGKLSGRGEIGQIARDHRVIGCRLGNIGDDLPEDFRTMMMPFPTPGQTADDAFQPDLPQRQFGRWQMRVRQMGEVKGRQAD